MIEQPVRDMISGKNLGTLSVHLANGHIATNVMWVDATDEHVVINTEVHRAKYTAMQANPNVTITVWDATNPYRYVEVRGRVVGEVRGDEARAHIDELAQRYTGQPYAGTITSERVLLRIEPLKQRTWGV